MSWDVIIQSTKDIPSEDDMEINSLKSYLGQKSEVIKIVESVFGDVDFSDKSWGILDRKDFSIEFNMDGPRDKVDCIILHVRGEDTCLETIEKLCKSTGWYALDTSTMDIIDFSDRKNIGFYEWKDFSDKVIKDLEEDDGKVQQNVKLDLNTKNM
ncbi:hypothetical protein [Hathewaya massiliensis]|uniref:hypothetical protein n=1 Tax=Hathewaya massiliensis TaxID=1964382 RepID=UPI001157BF6A|nr:hypothetical protein [Hathewaya massiliensis]